MYEDFRHFLKSLEQQNKLLRVTKEVDTGFNMAAGVRKISDNDGPALLFENIRGFSGWRSAGGVYATQKLLALALGLPMEAGEAAILRHYLEHHKQQLPPRMVPTGPVKEIIIKGDDVDLGILPMSFASELDGGRYLTAGVEIARHPETGVQNVSIHRRMLLGKNRTTILARGYQHLATLIAAAEKRGEALGVATVIGVDPTLVIASQLVAPPGIDEAGAAGAFRGAPLDFVKCETIDVAVPANAEIVIEGVVVPGEKAPDGPFGEFPGNYYTFLRGTQVAAPVIEVTAITMRKDPIFQTMLTGMPMTENHILRKWAIMTAAHEIVSQWADVKAIAAPSGGGGQLHLIVSIAKTDDDQPRRVLDALLNGLRSTKHIMVVDADIDVYNPVDVEWAMATRVRADEDLVVLPAGEPPRPAKLGIDATMPMSQRKWYVRASVPGVESVDYV